MTDCLFCKIIKGEIPSEIVFENDFVIGFKDINPQAAIHYLFINKKHTANINELSQDSHQLQYIFNAISDFTKMEKLESTGFRLVTNLGSQAGQTVFHTHIHLLAGETLGSFGR